VATLIFGIGAPGSGKSSILKNFAEENAYEFISIDELKIQKLGRVQDVSPSISKEIWDEARTRMKECLEMDHSVVFDSTFTRREWRDHFLSVVRTIPNVMVEALFFDIPIEHILERNTKRGAGGGKLTPEAYVRESHERLHESAPSLEEDFDILIRIDENGIASTLKGREDSTLLQYLEKSSG
jgi:predicted kinase